MSLAMRRFLGNAWTTRLSLAVSLLLSGMVLCGCVSKAKADAQARAAFFAGQQQALRQMQGQQLPEGPTVTVLGAVQNHLVPWTRDLTLAKALVAAGYIGTADPVEIIITRDGVEKRVDPKGLLEGQDAPLEPRDVVEVK